MAYMTDFMEKVEAFPPHVDPFAKTSANLINMMCQMEKLRLMKDAKETSSETFRELATLRESIKTFGSEVVLQNIVPEVIQIDITESWGQASKNRSHQDVRRLEPRR